MYLVQDIVVNHTGNFFDYVGGWDPADPARFWQANPGSQPQKRPSQKPFDMNDPRDPRQRRAGIYHWTPAVADYTERRQELDFQMSGLDDLNTENPAVRRALRASYGHWIREVGVDAFRVDTAFYVPPEFFLDFLHGRDPKAPGIAEVARRTGRSDFLVFGEGFGIDRPFDDAQARKIESYMTGADGRPVLPGMLNFPLYGALNDVFARGRPPAELAHRIGAMVQRHARPHLMPSFVDNHDVDRFVAGGGESALRQALLALFTLPGIPVVYYGTEQGLREQRASMFAAGWGSGGRDRFDTAAPLYRHIARLAALRRAEPLFSRGMPTVRAASEARPGVLAWSMQLDGRQALVLMNTADTPVLAARIDTGLPAGASLQPLLALGVDEQPGRTVAADGSVTLTLPARAAVVWKAGPAPVPATGAAGTALPARVAAPAATPPPLLELDPIGEQALTGDALLRGRMIGLAEARLVVDGDVAAAAVVRAGPDGRFEARLDTGALVDPKVRHGVVLWGGDAAPQAVSALRTFRVERAWKLLAEVDDPADDDHGPDGRYVYPTDPSWGASRQMDLRRVRVFGAAGALRIELEPRTITSSWNPPAGFDHVHFTVFIELAGRPGGATVMPLQDGVLPAGMRWHRRLRAGGWSAALFSDAEADASREGTPVTPGPQVAVDRERGVVSLVLPAAALGPDGAGPGTRVWVTTWDYDGGYRALQAAPAPFAIGGAASGPKVMDSSPVIVLP
jgi:glycosidase